MVQFHWMLCAPLPHGGAGTVFTAGVPSGLYSGQAGFCFSFWDGNETSFITLLFSSLRWIVGRRGVNEREVAFCTVWSLAVQLLHVTA